MKVNITDPSDIEKAMDDVLTWCGKVHILINNAANDPKVDPSQGHSWSRFENYPLQKWDGDIAVGLTGAFLCSQILGRHMAEQGGGVILNIASDLGVIAPDQRIYTKTGLPEDQQPAKPVTYSVVKHGLIGLTKYLATYWAGKNVRVNALSPGGIFNGQPEDFLEKLIPLIPMGRMASRDEYRAAVVFLVSDASSYMTGQNLIVDGGRTCW
jgi:NAD(P)-dependent dehydrogenase (short-subunit alcohol dehydrogenase family)